VLLAEAQNLARLSIGHRGLEPLKFARHRRQRGVPGQKRRRRLVRDDLISQTLTGDGHYGLVVPGQGDPAQRTFSDLLWQAGGEWVDESNKPSFNAAVRR
jgi:hypothetical protein